MDSITSALSEADSASAHHGGLYYGKYEVVRREGRGWVNSEASNGLSSPR